MQASDLDLSIATDILLDRLDVLHAQTDTEKADFQHAWCQGYVAALMLIGAISFKQCERLSRLTSNAWEHAPCWKDQP